MEREGKDGCYDMNVLLDCRATDLICDTAIQSSPIPGGFRWLAQCWGGFGMFVIVFFVFVFRTFFDLYQKKLKRLISDTTTLIYISPDTSRKRRLFD